MVGRKLLNVAKINAAIQSYRERKKKKKKKKKATGEIASTRLAKRIIQQRSIGTVAIFPRYNYE